MRYLTYKLINDLCNSIIEAINYIKSNRNIDIVIKLLQDCKQSINIIDGTLKTNISSIEDINAFSIINSAIVETDELLQLISLNMEINVDKLFNIITQISYICRNQINIKLKVVFIAELGEKWDSMESVYWAFKKRKDCDVSVVIEPIYRAIKDKNGNIISDTILKDFLTPLGIKHIPYNLYDFEKDKPDMTIISQPYESVTIKKFWPESISNYSKIVYIPYTTTIANSESTRTANCKLPVYYYAWKIIAQSQIIKDMHKKEAYHQGKNVIVTGLPKWDIVCNLDKSNINISSEWTRKFKNKKVILLNTHYTSANEFQVYDDIINYFYNRTDVALLWRPHPMTNTMYKIYYPQLMKKWIELNEKVENSENIIIDNNASYIEAFTISDAMISHMSSMIPQYVLTKKPIFVFHPKKLLDVKSDWVIDYSEFDSSTSLISDEWKDFVEKLGSKDDKLDIRLKSIKKDLAAADGHIGEKVCLILINELKNEMNLS